MTETRPQPKLPRVPPAKQGRVKQRQCGLTACRKSSQEQSLEAVGLCLLHAAWADLLSLGPGASVPTCLNSPPTGKPDAGNPPVRFGGRGGTTVPSLPLSGGAIRARAKHLIERIFPSSRSKPLERPIESSSSGPLKKVKKSEKKACLHRWVL